MLKIIKRAVPLLAGFATAYTISLPAQAQGDVRVRWDSYAPEVLESDSLAAKWNQEILVAIRVIAPPPTVSARHLAVIHTAMYDAWAAYDDKAVGTRLGGKLRRPPAERTPANREKAISYATYVAAIDQFPTQAHQFRAMMRRLGYDPERSTTDSSTPEGVGVAAAQAVLAFRHHDGSNQLGDLNPKGVYTDYTTYKHANTHDKLTDLNRWQPLRSGNGLGGFNDVHARLAKIGARPRQKVTVELGGFDVQRCVTPHWGNVIPFGLGSGDELRPGPPLLWTDADLKAAAGEDNEKYSDVALGDDEYPTTFRQQARQILRYSALLTEREKAIAEYWADGPLSESPPGHWNVLAQYVARRDRHSLEQDVKMFFVLGNALMDASIAAWDAKRHYDYVRPVTAVHALFSGTAVTGWAGPSEGVKPVSGTAWRPYQELYFATPPFPEYVSGHSTFSFAAAQTLKLFSGSDAFGAFAVVKPGSSAIETGHTPKADVELRWPTFTDAATQAALSRRYGGIHFAQGDLEGRKMGRVVGDKAWQRARGYFDGTAATPVSRPFRNLYAVSKP